MTSSSLANPCLCLLPIVCLSVVAEFTTVTYCVVAFLIQISGLFFRKRDEQGNKPPVGKPVVKDFLPGFPDRQSMIKFQSPVTIAFSRRPRVLNRVTHWLSAWEKFLTGIEFANSTGSELT